MLKAPIIMPNGDKVYPEKGTPQGGILSPLLANIVLNELDWWIASQLGGNANENGVQNEKQCTGHGNQEPYLQGLTQKQILKKCMR